LNKIIESLMASFRTDHELSPDLPESELFEHFASYLYVASKVTTDFSSEDLVVGCESQPSLDAVAVIVNGNVVRYPDEINSLAEANGYLDVDFVFIQAKTSQNFDSSALGSLADCAERLLKGNSIASDNNRIAEFLTLRNTVIKKAILFRNRKPRAELLYVTTGRVPESVDPNFSERKRIARERLLATQILDVAEIVLAGADELQQLSRSWQNSVTREVIFTRKIALPSVPNVLTSYLGVLPIREFMKLLEGEQDKILASIFYDNVRDYQLMNDVNAGIASTLAEKESWSRFMLMNNGITIIAKRIVSTGEPITLEDYQIVNGCQTSHVIWENRERLLEADLFVPVKVVATSDEQIISDIIRATNSQTNVSRLQLQAATDFQKKLEDCFAAFTSPGLKYERRSKQYAARTVARSKVISQYRLLKAFAAIFMSSPHLVTKGFKTVLQRVGESVFVERHRPEVYVYAATLCWAIEELVRKRKIDHGFAAARFHIAMVYHQLQKGAPSNQPESAALQKFCTGRIEHLADLENFAETIRPALRIVEDALAVKSRNGLRQSAFTGHLIQRVRDTTS
jgi:hypothetical protein